MEEDYEILTNNYFFHFFRFCYLLLNFMVFLPANKQIAKIDDEQFEFVNIWNSNWQIAE